MCKVTVEVGPGAGEYEFRPQLCPSFNTVYIDIRPPRNGAWRPATWVVADAQFLPLRNECADVLYASHVIEHLEEPARFLEEVKRVLKPGAHAHIRTPNFLSPNAREDPDHKHVFTFMSLAKLARKAGLAPHFIGINISPRLPSIIYRAIKLIILLVSNELYLLAEKQH